MTRTRAFAAAGTSALLALTLAACSDDSDSPTDPSSSSNASSSSSSDTSQAGLQDRSDQVFDAYEGSAQVLGSTSGEVTMGIGGGRTGEVTFEVTDVTATADATVLSYQLVADRATRFGMRGEFWFQQPALRVPGEKVRSQPLTAALPEYRGETADTCVCTAVRDVLTEPQPQEAVYPPLPEDVDEIDVILNDLDPVTVPVSR